MKENPHTPGVTQASGFTFVSSVVEPYHVGDIDAKTIYELTNNLYVAGPVTQTANLVIAGGASIEVYDDNGDPVESVSRELNAMFSKPGCSLAEVARSSMFDVLNWGISLYNWVWERKNSKLVCSALTRIHPFNMAEPPAFGNTNVTYGRLLRGIVYDRKERRTRYFHRSDTGAPFEIPESDLLVVRDNSADYPDGKSTVYPIAPIVEFINYAWNTLGQQMYRTGAPIIFIKITDAKPERYQDGVRIPSDVEYAQEVAANWGKDTTFPLRDNFEIIQVSVNEGSLAVKSIDFAQQTIRDYLNPNGMIGKDGSLISGNSDASLRLLNNSIKGWIQLLETALSAIPNYYLQYNGYPSSYTAKVTIEHSVVEDWSRKLQTAQIGFNTKTMTVNEVRELLGREGLSDEELSKISEEWANVTPPANQPFNPFEALAHSDHPSRGNRAKHEAMYDNSRSEIDRATDELMRSLRAALREEMK